MYDQNDMNSFSHRTRTVIFLNLNIIF